MGARRYRGMGQRPMLNLSHATYPTARGAACPACGCQLRYRPTRQCGGGRRWVKHGDDPRGAASASPRPCSSLINRTSAAGVPAAPGYSAGKHSFLEELPSPARLTAPLVFAVGKRSFLEGSPRYLSARMSGISAGLSAFLTAGTSAHSYPSGAVGLPFGRSLGNASRIPSLTAARVMTYVANPKLMSTIVPAASSIIAARIHSVSSAWMRPVRSCICPPRAVVARTVSTCGGARGLV